MILIVFLLIPILGNAQIKTYINHTERKVSLLEKTNGYEPQIDSVLHMDVEGISKNTSIYYFNRIKLTVKGCLINITSTESPVFSSLRSISSQQRDSLIYTDLKERFSPSPWSNAKLIFYKISPMQHLAGFCYVDIFETTYRDNGYSKYISSMIRIFVIDGIEYRFSVYTKGAPYNKSVCSSRQAICHEFEQLVNNISIE